ncbi:MAG: hypothetical protein QNK20_01130 [Aureibaculum sp.]|nr:hypothetical protein [Aureibaculum sp.]
MKKTSLILTFLIFITASLITAISAQTESDHLTDSTKQIENFSFIIGQAILNKSDWLQPYRFQDKNIKTLSVKININRTTDVIEPLDFDLFTLMDETKKLRIRPSGVYYLKSDKKKYLKSKAVNTNYNAFNETNIDGFENFEATSYKTNFLGLKKKNTKASVKSLRKVTIKAKKTSYFVDFPAYEGFTYGKIYYKNNPIGFAAVKN